MNKIVFFSARKSWLELHELIVKFQQIFLFVLLPEISAQPCRITFDRELIHTKCEKTTYHHLHAMSCMYVKSYACDVWTWRKLLDSQCGLLLSYTCTMKYKRGKFYSKAPSKNIFSILSHSTVLHSFSTRQVRYIQLDT